MLLPTLEFLERVNTSSEFLERIEIIKDGVDGANRVVLASIEKNPFIRGSMKLVFNIIFQGNSNRYVLKVFDPILKLLNTDRLIVCEKKCSDDSRNYAKLFNEQQSIRQINFIPCTLVKLLDRPNTPFAIVEKYQSGKFIKHNNNYGDISSERLLPQAFSHFTHVESSGKLLVCDIQGWEDLYTDPQIHYTIEKNPSAGNHGEDGIFSFYKSHVCNVICGILDLPRIYKGRKVADWTVEEIYREGKKIGLLDIQMCRSMMM